MAIITNNILLKGMKGMIGKQIVTKQYGKKGVATKYPDMSNIVPSDKQKQQRALFAEATAYAQGINNDPVKKASYKKKVKKGQTVYHFAIKEYIKKNTNENAR